MLLSVAGDGSRLACRDFGGQGLAVLCLHGLAGHSGEWAPLAAALGSDYHVLALDQRGHGHSARRPADVTRHAFVADVAAVVEDLRLAPIVLIGQSMGANTAFLTAAQYPELVAALVVIEGSPDGPSPDLADRIQAWLDRWPRPFPDIGTARAFFAQEGLEPDAWAAGLEHRDDRLWPAFEP